MSQSEDIGYIKAKVEGLEEDMKDVKECLGVLRQDAAFRRKVKKGIYYTVTIAGLIAGAKFGDIKGLFK